MNFLLKFNKDFVKICIEETVFHACTLHLNEAHA